MEIYQLSNNTVIQNIKMMRDTQFVFIYGNKEYKFHMSGRMSNIKDQNVEKMKEQKQWIKHI